MLWWCRLFKQCWSLPAWHCFYSGESCFSNVRVYLPGTVLQGCRLFKQCQNLPAGHCVTVVKAVLAKSESTCRALCYSDAGCLSSARTYLLGTVLQWCRLFKLCQNLPAGHCVTVVKAVLAMSEPTCQALCCSGESCFSNVRTYLQGTVLWWCRLFKQCWSLPAWHCFYNGESCFSNVRVYLPGTVLQGCRLFKQCQNLPAGHCVTVVKAVLAKSESTCRALCYSDAGCLSSARTYLLGTVLQWCRLFKRCQNLPAGHCVHRGANCLSSVRTYLRGTVLQWCRLFKRCQNLPAVHSVTVVQAF